MRCGSCSWDNPAGITFCTNCGKRVGSSAQAAPAAQPAPVEHVEARGSAREPSEHTKTDGAACTRCGAAVVLGLRFCRACGAPVGGASTAIAASGHLPRHAEQGEERRAEVRGAAREQNSSDAGSAPSAPQAARGPGFGACTRCGEPRSAGAAFCRRCGAPIGDALGQAYPPAVVTNKPPPPAAGVASMGARIVTLLKDGSEGRTFPLGAQDVDVGSTAGDVTFPDDPYLSARHARITCRGDDYILRDLDSVNGIYVRLRDPAELRDRDMVLLGQQVLRFELLTEGELILGPAYQCGVLVFGTPEAKRFARLIQYSTEGIGRDVHYLFRDETVIGRENGDIVFTDDPFLSRRHAAIRADHHNRRVTLHDLGSSNGTALRMRGEHVLKDGDQFRIGRHLFRFEAGSAGRESR